MREANPLQWPQGWPRKETYARETSRFKTSFHLAVNGLLDEIRLLGGKYPVITSNLELRQDGLPYSNQRMPEDSGVAVYFTLDGREQCIPCDKWRMPSENIRAIQKTVEALRGIERWGAKEMVKAAFKGFTALGYDPDDKNKIVPAVQYFNGCHDEESLKLRYRELVKQIHPDAGGNEEDFNEMRRQYEEKKRR